MREAQGPLDPLIHDVKATCANLRTAADLLRDMPAKDTEEFLGAMVEQAEKLAKVIADFKTRRGLAK